MKIFGLFLLGLALLTPRVAAAQPSAFGGGLLSIPPRGGIERLPSVGISDAFWDFGPVSAGKVIAKTLTFTNKGTGILSVKARSSCECVRLSRGKFEIAPQKNLEIKITFDTAGYSGKKTEYVFIDTNDPQNKHLTWLIEGEIIGNRAPRVSLKLFYAANCRVCAKLKDKIIPGIAKRNNLDVETNEFLLDKPGNYERLLAVEKELGDENNKLPAVAVGRVILGGQAEIEARLEKEILLAAGTRPPAKPGLTPLTAEDIKKKLDSFGIFSIAAAGLVDGLNPCAFAAIVFLIAYLTMIQKKTRTEVFWTGVTFIIGAFAVYFLIGLGLSKLVAAAGLKNPVSRIIYGAAGVVTLGLSYYSFADFFAVKAIERGEKAKVVLQLPNYFRWKIYGAVEKYGKLRYMAPFGFALGVVVSALEFFCTGQVYLPAIMYMVSTGQFVTKGILYLSLYCFAFVIPLIIIFAAMLFGLKSERIEEIGRRHIANVKFATAIVFLALSVFMFIIVLS